MAGAKTSETFPCTVEQFYSVITDYENYPEFLTEVQKCEVIETRGKLKLVEYSVYMVKTFKYRLWMDESEGPNKLTWKLDSGDLFKVSNGTWELQAEADKVRATYEVEAKFKVFVPGPISKALVNVNLPNMMSAYQQRIKELYG